MTTASFFWALAAAATAAATAVLSKAGLRGADPDAAQLVRTGVVALAIAAVVGAGGKWREAASFSVSAWTLLAMAGLATAASWLCYYRALAEGEASRVAVVDKLSVPMIGIIAALAFEERLGVRGWTGVALATIGAMLVVFEQ
jgi:bacterial/archaeal transporter family protein